MKRNFLEGVGGRISGWVSKTGKGLENSRVWLAEERQGAAGHRKEETRRRGRGGGWKNVT